MHAALLTSIIPPSLPSLPLSLSSLPLSLPSVSLSLLPFLPSLSSLPVDDHEAHPECVEAGTCNINGGDVLVVFWSILFASMSIGQCGPQLSAVAEAKGAAAKLIEIVTRIPAIDSEDQSGEKLEHVQGKIEFKDVSFTYPTRPDAPIFQGFSLVVEPGQTVALVGSSGSGKSTVVNLMERFYDPSEGEVLVDGTEIKKLNLKYWRGQVGLVSQEPTLFATSIAQNIAYGSMKTVTMPEGEKEGGKEHAVGGVPMAQIVEAAKAANGKSTSLCSVRLPSPSLLSSLPLVLLSQLP